MKTAIFAVIVILGISYVASILEEQERKEANIECGMRGGMVVMVPNIFHWPEAWLCLSEKEIVTL